MLQSEAVQHWLLAALDESSDAIVVVDRIGREVVRNSVARRFAGARTGEVLAEEAIAELRAGRADRPQLRTRAPALRSAPPGAAAARVPVAPRRRDRRRGRVHPRHLGVAAGRERAARLRRQRESRAEDADRRARPARGDDGRDRRRRGGATARRPGRARGRPARAHRRRPARPQHDRSAGGADPRADAGAAARSRNASTSCRPRPTRPRCRCIVGPEPPDIEIFCDHAPDAQRAR